MHKLGSSIYTILLCLVFASSQAQETKQVSAYRKIDRLAISEKFSVLKSDRKVKHGPYEASISYYSEKGQFEFGKKTGIWECYYDGKLTQKYDFSTQTFLVQEYPKIVFSVIEVDDQGNAVKDLGTCNLFVGGDAKMGSIIRRSIRYPTMAQETSTQGLVIIEAKLDKLGNISDAKAVSNIGFGLEEEGLRAFKLLSPDWVPVFVDGKPVDVKFRLQIKFTLS